jgi:hypothetical protein
MRTQPFFFFFLYREPSCAHKIKISLHSGVFGKAAEWLCVKKKKKEGSKWNTQEEDAYSNNNAMFFWGGRMAARERERKVHPGRIRGKFETISTNRETDTGLKRPIHLSHFSLSLSLACRCRISIRMCSRVNDSADRLLRVLSMFGLLFCCFFPLRRLLAVLATASEIF